jgi:aspartyl-tRNA(Asn)/glutamyl-tRNA(Gln) amidotransferase subunit A
VLGTHVLRSGFQDRYYIRALRIRQGIKARFEKLFEQCDAILMPVFPTRAFDRDFPLLAQKAAALYTCIANLAGLPALSFPVAVSAEGSLPVGVQLLGPVHAEETLLDIAADYELQHPFTSPRGVKAFWS